MDESVKMFFMARLMQLRIVHTEIFTSGSYHELKIYGTDANHWIAFSRQLANEVHEAIIVIVPRLNSVRKVAAQIELDEKLQGRTWIDALSGAEFGCDKTVDVATLPLRWAVLYGGVSNT